MSDKEDWLLDLPQLGAIRHDSAKRAIV